MKITVTSIPVKDQDKALDFYANKLGFIVKHDIPLGEARWLTLVSPQEPDGVELLLEPNSDYPAMKALKQALVNDGIPFTQFQVDDVHAEYTRLKDLGVLFTIEPTNMGPTTVAILDDTCGNLIQVYQMNM